jgi:hypothetical protein
MEASPSTEEVRAMRRVNVPLVVVLMLVAVVPATNTGLETFAIAAPTSAVVLPASVSVPISVGEDDCALLCDDGPTGCQPSEHDAYEAEESDPEWWRAGGKHPAPPNHCFGDSCDEKHGGCTTIPPLAFEQLRSAIQGVDTRGMGAVLAAHADHVLFNQERSAIQVLGCSGATVVHIPLPERVAASFSAHP